LPLKSTGISSPKTISGDPEAREAAKEEKSPDKIKVQLYYFHMHIRLLLSSPLIEKFRSPISLQPRPSQVFDDTICYRLWKRKHVAITLQREFGIYPEDLCGCGPGLLLPSQSYI